MLGIDIPNPVKLVSDGIDTVADGIAGASKAVVSTVEGGVKFVGDIAKTGLSLIGVDGLIDRPGQLVSSLIPNISILQRTPEAGSSLPAEFDGFLADIRKFGDEINRIKEQLAKTTDPAERAALFAELQFNMNQQSETISLMSKMLQDLNQNVQAILQNIGR